jgi:hypothetical protein
MEAVLSFAGIVAALALSLAAGVALARAGLGGLFRLFPAAAARFAPAGPRSELFFAGDALPRAPLALSPLPAGSISGRSAQGFAGGRRR